MGKIREYLKRPPKLSYRQWIFGVKNPSHHIPATNKIAIFASGSGTNAERVMDEFISDDVTDVVLIVTDNPHAQVIKRAEIFGVKVHIVCCGLHKDAKYLQRILDDSGVTHIALLGYLKLLPAEIVSKYKGKSVNLHPSLLPKYGGKGMFGSKVHQAVAKANEPTSGFTLHRVDDEYDTGQLLSQHEVELPENASAQEIERLVRGLEEQYVAEDIAQLIKSAKL